MSKDKRIAQLLDKIAAYEWKIAVADNELRGLQSPPMSLADEALCRPARNSFDGEIMPEPVSRTLPIIKHE